MTTGKLAGIARHAQPKGPMETLGSVSVTISEGLQGDSRSARATLKPGRERQVSLIETACWRSALAEAAASVDWWQSRRNLLVDGLRIPRELGARVQIGQSLVLEVTAECDPCLRMDALHEGLKAAMMPDWRGGFLARVIEDGEVAVGDEVRIF
ncbi:MOSC domain-containing protein [Altererythrobacter sp. Root672]|uniref:MOSC domain-containing protein n=1 Tax=Altererythrobacter sp. Root672 TaxID=1736584 RepID=UPI0006F415C0|nr:MOSC domain-containing protein [Altererythrobacter sp. Root672]KRA83221.1 molybdenum cofactor biosysynthesis protein [Altererythrobacter sp. Root672]